MAGSALTAPRSRAFRAALIALPALKCLVGFEIPTGTISETVSSELVQSSTICTLVPADYALGVIRALHARGIAGMSNAIGVSIEA